MSTTEKHAHMKTHMNTHTQAQACTVRHINIFIYRVCILQNHKPTHAHTPAFICIDEAHLFVQMEKEVDILPTGYKDATSCHEKSCCS